MKKFQKKRLQRIHKLFLTADAIVVEQSPMLHNWSVSDLEGEEHNEVVNITWSDEDETTYRITLDEYSLARGHITDHGVLICQDNEGDETKVQFFQITPTDTSSIPEGKCLWTFHDSHGGDWSTGCGTSYDASQFGCRAVTVCPNCGRETTTDPEE